MSAFDWDGRKSRHSRPQRRREIDIDPPDQRRRTSDFGRILRGMRVSWPLAFGGAFQTHLTGLDNLKFVCRVYGVDYKPLVPFVEEFTELGIYFREPVLHYSNGMLTRLAFALSMAIEFDCFLIDEAMVVGDVRFHERCHVELFHKRKDRAFILVTHDANVIKLYCKNACVLHEGNLLPFPTSMRPTNSTGHDGGAARAGRVVDGVPNHEIDVEPPLRILLELRPALGGHAGIPQATRLLFRSLALLEDVHVEGLLQSGERSLTPGLPPRGARLIRTIVRRSAVEPTRAGSHRDRARQMGFVRLCHRAYDRHGDQTRPRRKAATDALRSAAFSGFPVAPVFRTDTAAGRLRTRHSSSISGSRASPGSPCTSARS